MQLDPVTLFYGMSMTGKTARMFHALRNCKRVVLVDPKCAQLVKMKGWEHLWPQYEPPQVKKEKDEKLGRWKTREVVDYFSSRKSFRVVIHLREYHKENLELLCLYLMGLKDCVLAVDELFYFAPPGAPGMLGRYFGRVLVSGTHDGIFFMGTIQGAAMVHNRVRMNVSREYIFRTEEKNDLALLRAKLPADYPDAIDELPAHVCIIRTNGILPAYTDYSQAGKLGRILPAKRF